MSAPARTGRLTYLVAPAARGTADRCAAATSSAPGTPRATPPWHSTGASTASSASSAMTARIGDLALADRDACCWADAVDGTIGLRNSYGLAVCLRLLALVDLLARVRWADSLCLLRRDGAELHPSLLRRRGEHSVDRRSALRRNRLPRPARAICFRARSGRPDGSAPDRSHIVTRAIVALTAALTLVQCAAAAADWPGAR